MSHLRDLFSLDLFAERVAGGYVRSKTSDDGRVVVHNYTEKAQYEAAWDEVTRNCRGLITTPDGIVLARGFPKFFNVSEHAPGNRAGLPPLPDDAPIEVSEKVDGSLGILFFDAGRWRIATRGSADSEQARYATEKLLPDLDLDEGWCPPCGVTCLFEIVYPSNRIVVDYGQDERVVFLAALDNATGRDVEIAIPDCWPRARTFPALPLDELPEQVRDDEEGFVVRWADGTRAKVKGAEYVRLHRIVTGVTSRRVWEHLSEGLPLDELLDRVPDEFAAWLQATITDLETQQAALVERAVTAYKSTFQDLVAEPDERAARKLFATAVMRQDAAIRPALFQLYDKRSIQDWAWKLVRPENARPFLVES